MKPYSEIALTTCLICDWLWSVAVIGGCGVAVFGFGASGWWFLLAVFMASCWNCKAYRSPAQIAAEPEVER